MARNSRQSKILEIISAKEIETQDELVASLKEAKFDVNKLTEFRVTIIARPESGTIKWHDKEESGQIKPESGTITPIAQLYDTNSQDEAVYKVVSEHPGIKKEQVFLSVKTSLRSVQRTLERLSDANKIEYRGSKRTGGWFVKT